MINMLLKRRMENKKKNKKGFTLVELIVVLVIIAILAAVLVPTVSGYIGRAKKTAAQSALKNVITAASSAGTDIIAANSSVKSSDKDIFKTYIEEVGGSDILSGVKDIVLDPATGTVIYASYSDGTYSSTYYYDQSGNYVYKNEKAATPSVNPPSVIKPASNGSANTAYVPSAATYAKFTVTESNNAYTVTGADIVVTVANGT
jgi:prepilin-type N-terminal cleavage/methylation domain-containing protein